MNTIYIMEYEYQRLYDKGAVGCGYDYNPLSCVDTEWSLLFRAVLDWCSGSGKDRYF